MKGKINLSENHTRVVSVIMRIVEKKADEISETLRNPKNEISYRIISNVNNDEILTKLETVNKIKLLVRQMFQDYYLKEEILYQSRIIDAKKNHIWSILHDSFSAKLNNYGVFKEELAVDYDNNIKQFLNLLEEL